MRWKDRGPRWRVTVFVLALGWLFSTAWTVGWLVSDGSPAPAPMVHGDQSMTRR
ncbi:hypothetical protein JK358_21830 [Nocardia sp. 2]|uniref:Uncharacterized protein n=1 Tax=Nocardia acididurans TaxID=2802282 RepID=A0ABS1M8S3_9NOCA|nr:hypothetical protein [Nocardia acididurans]MBL1077042.1 hypothetical protein [Nocardia acididurans]